METQLFYLIIFTVCLWLILDDFFGGHQVTNLAGKAVEMI